MSSKRYTDEFKAEAVKQVLERGRAVEELAPRLGVNMHSLYEWVRLAKAAAGAPSASSEVQASAWGESAEVRRLKAELRRVTEERDILKKAAAYFAKG
jgi:transposase